PCSLTRLGAKLEPIVVPPEQAIPARRGGPRLKPGSAIAKPAYADYPNVPRTRAGGLRSGRPRFQPGTQHRPSTAGRGAVEFSTMNLRQTSLGIGVLSFAHGHANAYCEQIATFHDA